MTSTAPAPPELQHKPFSRMQSVALVFCCTVFGAAAQILMKTGVTHAGAALQIAAPASYWPFIFGLATNLPLLAGYCLYGINTLLLILALRDGELSVLYPVIALTYVWVTMLSMVFFHESANPLKLAGIAVIVLGVTVLGKAGTR